MDDARQTVITPPGKASGAVPRTLRELRYERDWPLTQLAAESGIHVATLSQIERGRIAASPDEIRALEQALGLQLAPALMVVHWSTE